jgi:dihydrofolate reductase
VTKVAIVAALARGGVIGRDNTIPWRLPEDLDRFRALTTGHAVVMGRRTWESLPDRFRPLPGRRNVVVTRNPAWTAEGAERAGSLEGALDLIGDEPQVFVIGGAELYAAALPLADELYLTEVDLEVEGDTFFPGFGAAAFEERSRESHVSTNGTTFAFVTYERGSPRASAQLEALADVDHAFHDEGIAYWLLGGWAVDFHVGSVTRAHDDVDIAVWLQDLPRIAELLAGDGWAHAPEPDEDGGTGYERAGVRLELTYLERDADSVYTPLRRGRGRWAEDALAEDVRELLGTRARIVSQASLVRTKSSVRDDPEDAAKDRADTDVLTR